MNINKKYKITSINDYTFKMNKDDFDSFTELYCLPVFIDDIGNTCTIYKTKTIIKEKSTKMKKLTCTNCRSIIAIYPEDYSIPKKEFIPKDIACCNNPILEWI